MIPTIPTNEKSMEFALNESTTVVPIFISVEGRVQFWQLCRWQKYSSGAVFHKD